ncbi:hypothetical protein AABB24_038479 [Solanum stoloniferum]|uniref:Late blight resistance protein n=1 Tax=Solanum stoloniferum TaxID=62892 RepID=A0ABD2QY84_9SOLN
MQGWDSLRSSKIRIMQILIDSKDEETKDIDGMNLPQQYFLQKIYYPIELKELDQVLNHEHAHFYHFPTHENTHHLPMQHCEEIVLSWKYNEKEKAQVPKCLFNYLRL